MRVGVSISIKKNKKLCNVKEVKVMGWSPNSPIRIMTEQSQSQKRWQDFVF